MSPDSQLSAVGFVGLDVIFYWEPSLYPLRSLPIGALCMQAGQETGLPPVLMGQMCNQIMQRGSPRVGACCAGAASICERQPNACVCIMHYYVMYIRMCVMHFCACLVVIFSPCALASALTSTFPQRCLCVFRSSSRTVIWWPWQGICHVQGRGYAISPLPVPI